MPTIGIIAEYNPFHNGHRYQLEQIKKKYPDSKIIIAMSGSVSQRGEITILSKWERAVAAINNGADLVLELPAVYSLGSAQDFARGGVKLFHALNIDKLAFGTEYPEEKNLFTAAKFLEDKSTEKILHENIKNGLSYAAAISKILQENFSLTEDIIKEPNTILALEYLRAIYHINSAIQPLPILRTGASHHDIALKNNIASGSAIRQALTTGNTHEKIASAVPAEILEHLIHNAVDNQALFPILLYQLNNMHLNSIQQSYAIKEGIENRLLEGIKKTASLKALVQYMSTRRYSLARCQRAIMGILLHLTDKQMVYLNSIEPQYARILAFNDNGRQLIKKIKKYSALPVISKVSDFINSQDILNDRLQTDLQKMLYFDIKATDLQEICKNKPQLGRDFLISPRYIK